MPLVLLKLRIEEVLLLQLKKMLLLSFLLLLMFLCLLMVQLLEKLLLDRLKLDELRLHHRGLGRLHGVHHPLHGGDRCAVGLGRQPVHRGRLASGGPTRASR